MNKQRNLLKNIRNLFEISKDSLFIFFGGIFLNTINLLCVFAMIALGTNAVVNLYQDLSTPLGNTIFFILILAVLKGILSVGYPLYETYQSNRLYMNLKNKVYKKLHELAPSKFDNLDSIQYSKELHQSILQTKVLFSEVLVPLVSLKIVYLILFIYFCTIHIALGLFALFVYLILGYLFPSLMSSYTKATTVEQNNLDSFNKNLQHFLEGIDEIIQFDLGDQQIEILDKQAQQVAIDQKKLKQKRGTEKAIKDTLYTVFIFISILLGSYFVRNGNIEAHQIFVAILLFIASIFPLTNLITMINSLQTSYRDTSLLTDLMNEKTSTVIEDIPSTTIQHGIDESIHTISLKNVSFAYETKEVLENFSRSFKRGEIIGVKGRAGCGKSTLLKLLKKDYLPTSGEILFNGHNLQSWDSVALEKRVVYISSSTSLLPISILENLQVVAPNASMEDIKSICNKVGIHDAIEQLDKMYQTNVEDLSFNPKQMLLLMLARVLLQDADVILLDCPTKDLDEESQTHILNVIQTLLHDKLVILASNNSKELSISDKNILIKSLN